MSAYDIMTKSNSQKKVYPYTLKDVHVDTGAINPGEALTWVETDVVVTSDGFGYCVNPHGKRYQVESFNIGWTIVK